MSNVTPGYTFTGTTDPITFAKLNLLGQPTVTIGVNEVALTNMATVSSNNILLGRATTSAGNVEAIDLTTTGLGFYTGAGGTVTQSTNKSTGVTLSKMCGAITMNNASLNDATNVSFTVTNTLVAATDAVIAIHSSAGTAGAYQVSVNAVASTSYKITVRNVSGGALGEAIVLTVLVLKGVTS